MPYVMDVNQLVSRVMAEVQKIIHREKLPHSITLDEEDIEKGIRFTLMYLREAILFHRPAIFFDNVAWFYKQQAALPVPQALFMDVLTLLETELKKEGTAAGKRALMIREAINRLPGQTSVKESYLSQVGIEQKASETFMAALLDFDEQEARNQMKDWLNRHGQLRSLHQKLIQPVQYEVGRQWQLGKISVQQEHFSTNTIRKLLAEQMSVVAPVPRGTRTFLGMCAQDEHHSMGIQSVCDVLSMEGYRCLMLGSRVPDKGLESLMRQQQVAVAGISVSMPYHLSQAAVMIKNIRSYWLLQPVHILVGGQVFNRYPDLWRDIGADACQPDAEKALVHIASYLEKPETV